MSVIEIPESFTPKTLAQFMLDNIFTGEMTKVWNQADWVRLGGAYRRSAGDLRAGLAERGAACGTTGCVAGWATILTVGATEVIEAGTGFVVPGDWKEDGHGRRPYSAPGWRYPQRVAQEAFGLTDDQAAWLFGGERGISEVRQALQAIIDGEEWLWF